MKAKELIEILSKGPLDADVIICHSCECGYTSWYIDNIIPCFYGKSELWGFDTIQDASSEKPINTIAISGKEHY